MPTRRSDAFQVRWRQLFWMGKFSSAVHSRCYSRLGSGPVNSATTVLEKLSLVPFAPGKRQRTVLLKDKPRPGISGICLEVASCQEDCRDSMPYSL